MILTRTALFFLLRRLWPNLVIIQPGGLGNCVMPVSHYYCPGENELFTMISENFIDKYQYKTANFKCHEYSLILLGWFRQEQYKRQIPHPYAVFSCSVPGHDLNGAVLSDSTVCLIEPQTDKMWWPEGYEKENPVFFITF